MIDTIKAMLGMDDEVEIRRASKTQSGSMQLIASLTELLTAINLLKAERDSLRNENKLLRELLESIQKGATND